MSGILGLLKMYSGNMGEKKSKIHLCGLEKFQGGSNIGSRPRRIDKWRYFGGGKKKEKSKQRYRKWSLAEYQNGMLSCADMVALT